MRRFLYLLTFIGAIALIVGVFYFLRFRAEETSLPEQVAPGGLPRIPTQPLPAPSTSSGQAPSPEELPSGTTGIGEQKFGVIAQNEVLSYFVDDQNNAIIVQPDGQIAKITRGEASVLSSSVIGDLKKAEFSHDGKRILAAFGSRSNPQYSVFNVETKSWKPLASGVTAAAWSPTDYRIAHIKNQNGSMSLIILDLGNEKAKSQEVMKIRMEDINIFWLSPNQLILSDKPSALYAGSIWSVDIAKKTITAFEAGRLGLDSAWSQEAGMGLIFWTDLSRRGGRLGLRDAVGNVLNDLSFLTLPSKCAFATDRSGATTSTASQKFLYCAVPVNQEELQIRTLPDEYAKRSFFTQDNFYQINLADGSIKEILSGRTVDGDKLRIVGKNLFFINRLDGKLYAIALAE